MSGHPQRNEAASSVAIIPQAAVEQRGSQRLRTVYRVARVARGGVYGLARVFNLSDLGMMMSTPLDLCVGDLVTVDLSDSCTLTGSIMWHDGARCGVKFAAPIDGAAMLKRLFEERHTQRWRPLRVPISRAAIVRSEVGIQMVRIEDISQSGMKLAHDGRFRPGLPIAARLSPEVECRGVVRWSQDGKAGIMLTDPLSVDQLADIRRAAGM